MAGLGRLTRAFAWRRRVDRGDPQDHRAKRRIVIDWPGYSGPTTVEWNLASQNDGTTYVRISETGFVGDADDLMNYVVDSTQGFTWMLAGLKALLEHGVRLNLTADAHPKGVVEVR